MRGLSEVTTTKSAIWAAIRPILGRLPLSRSPPQPKRITFTVYNALGVMAAARELGVSLADSARVLGRSAGVKGRVEVVPVPGDYTLIGADEAHLGPGRLLQHILEEIGAGGLAVGARDAPRPCCSASAKRACTTPTIPGRTG